MRSDPRPGEYKVKPGPICGGRSGKYLVPRFPFARYCPSLVLRLLLLLVFSCQPSYPCQPRRTVTLLHARCNRQIWLFVHVSGLAGIAYHSTERYMVRPVFLLFAGLLFLLSYLCVTV